MHLVPRAAVVALSVAVITLAPGGVGFAAPESAAQRYEAIAKPMNKDFTATTADPLEKDSPRYERELLALPVTGKSKTDVKALVGAIRTAIADHEAANLAGSSKATQAKVNPAAEAMEADVLTFRHDLGLPQIPQGDAF